MKTLAALMTDQWRILTFRAPSRAIAENFGAYLTFGLVVTWLVGIGRYWDHPSAALWQYLGLGSLAYVFVLAAVIWLIALPMRPQQWSYASVLVFVTFTSAPALLYAIPVERFMPLSSAAMANVWFLAVVAAWRVALYVVFLRRFAKLPPVATTVVMLLPLVAIVWSLSALNLERAVFNVMGGIAEGTANDGAYFVVMLLTMASTFLLPVLVVAYSWIWWRRRGEALEG
jgi:hypothetical protein